MPKPTKKAIIPSWILDEDRWLQKNPKQQTTRAGGRFLSHTLEEIYLYQHWSSSPNFWGSRNMFFGNYPKAPKYKQILQVGEKTNHKSTQLQVYHETTSGIKGGTSSKTCLQLDHYPDAPWDWNMYLHLAAKS